eukprot:UN07014
MIIYFGKLQQSPFVTNCTIIDDAGINHNSIDNNNDNNNNNNNNNNTINNVDIVIKQPSTLDVYHNDIRHQQEQQPQQYSNRNNTHHSQ